MSTANAQHVRDRVDDFVAACRRIGIKATHQRIEIFKELAATGEHPDAESIYRRVLKRIPSMSFDTVYRTLRMLEEKNLIARVPSAQDRARFDANMERHHHFVCSSCGKIVDFTSPALDGFVPPPEVRRLGTVDSVQVELRGLCNECRVPG